jgi:hypothetical protein
MARNNQEASGETATETTAAAPAADNRSIVLKNGQKRADYIRSRWEAGVSRSDITKELNSEELNPTPDKKIPYQIVFQATKGRPGGPAPKQEAAAEAVSE